MNHEPRSGYTRRAVTAAIVGAVIATCGCSTWSAGATDQELIQLFARNAVWRVDDTKGTDGGGK